jgi:tetratricopeptide (TPR) repeat protein
MVGNSTSLKRQKITLLNNRSAMYEKAGCLDLAIDDCNFILEMENQHGKARPRKLRILESQKKWHEALQEVCASQLLFMQENKAYMQNGLPMPPPPIPSTKLEEILLHVVDMEKDTYLKQMQFKMPGKFTITQLLKSYSSYNDWSKAAQDGPTVATLTNRLKDAKSDCDKVPLLYRRALRYVLEREYEMATVDFELAFSMVTEMPDLIKSSGIDYVDLLEWVGMVRHWHFKLDLALECLQQAARTDPNRAGLLVKQAGVQLDAGKTDESLKLLEQALIIDPDCVDAMLHRSNLRIMQSKHEMAKADLERCLRLQPKNVMAQLRLATVLVSLNDAEGASRLIDQLTNSNESEGKFLASLLMFDNHVSS